MLSAPPGPARIDRTEYARELGLTGLRGWLAARPHAPPTVRTCPGNSGVGRLLWPRKPAPPSTSAANTFVTVPGDRRSEVGRTLAEPVPQSLGLLDQFGLWGNLGVSLLGFTGAIFVLQPGGAGTPELSLAAALTAIVVGTLLGATVLALAGIPGAQTGAPAMVLLRGLFGARVSYLPTALNVLQLFGWSIFELVTIATAAQTVAPGRAEVGVRADRGGGDRAADHPAARRDPGAAPVRHRRRARS